MAINSEKELLSKFVQLYQAFKQGEFLEEGLEIMFNGHLEYLTATG